MINILNGIILSSCKDTKISVPSPITFLQKGSSSIFHGSLLSKTTSDLFWPSYKIEVTTFNDTSSNFTNDFSNNHMKHLSESCPNIHFLKLYLLYHDPLVYDFDDDGLCAVVNACRHLVQVDLSRRLRVGDLGFVSLVQSSKKLRWLTLEGCANVTDETLKAIGKASCLVKLDLTGCFLITDLGLKYLANGDLKTRLKTLLLGKCDSITDDGIMNLKQMVCLVSLDLSDCGVNINGSQLSHITNIEDLSLCRLIKLTDDALFGIAKCLKLTELNLTGCKAITGKGLRAFAHHRRLEKLEFSSCHNYYWGDVMSVALTTTSLRRLHLDMRIKRTVPEAGSNSLIGNCLITWHDGGPMYLRERCKQCIEFGLHDCFFFLLLCSAFGILLLFAFAVAFIYRDK
ncbi:Leucine-rich repeat, cysteine-containing subtype [Artemisia annua]|uniref:Leucine-rich repeat, cysteine-containing subtype n=1 Tax=Artemisia annua TaxID=35608 RepID=A0A2U1KAP5_ARTAN|nr:Leucine-rich repeat, cysteine-containing subtype [Artemisia annua]